MKLSRIFFCLIILQFFTQFISANTNFYFVNIDYIINNSTAGKELKNKISSLINNQNEKFIKIENEFKNKENNLINQKNILEQKVFNEELNKLKQSIKDYSSEKKNTIDKINQENKTGLSILNYEINTILSEYSLENNIDIILNKNTVILGKKELDITNEILTRLNKKIKKINYK